MFPLIHFWQFLTWTSSDYVFVYLSSPCFRWALTFLLQNTIWIDCWKDSISTPYVGLADWFSLVGKYTSVTWVSFLLKTAFQQPTLMDHFPQNSVFSVIKQSFLLHTTNQNACFTISFSMHQYTEVWYSKRIPKNLRIRAYIPYFFSVMCINCSNFILK